MLAAAALFVAAGGFVHLREWLDIYRHVPADAAGSAVVRLGFPVNVAISLLVAVALVICGIRRSRFTPHVVVAAAVFQIGSLGALIATRTGSLLGWAEPSWTAGANQSLAVEVGALVALTAVAIIAFGDRHNERRREARLVARSAP